MRRTALSMAVLTALTLGATTAYASDDVVVHDLAVVGKDVIQRFYGRSAAYSYWTGCSTGGRQGYSEAQNYPHDFNGILAVAPAINWNQFIMADLWPQVVMNQERTFPTDCEFAEFQKAATEACGTNGVIADPRNCAYDPRRLVGRTIVCDGKQVTITAKDAEVVRKIWDGPRDEFHRQLWPGLPKGASFAGIAHTENGTAPGFPVSTAWVKTFLKRQPDFDTSTITYAQFAQLFRQSVAQFGDTIGTSDPDLSVFVVVVTPCGFV
ncbi:tannase/feruloyl esterase family alpha/beta hydrolase, partial [Kibdelosporangium lantanae]